MQLPSERAPALDAESAVTLHVSPAGKDDQPGTAARPIQTLEKVQSRLMEMPLVTDLEVPIANPPAPHNGPPQ